jgi:hypothetical protein
VHAVAAFRSVKHEPLFYRCLPRSLRLPAIAGVRVLRPVLRHLCAAFCAAPVCSAFKVTICHLQIVLRGDEG